MRGQTRRASGQTVLLKLDYETNERLLKTRERSGRSKTAEVLMRLKDHLIRYPDFYNSEIIDKEELKKTDKE
ncbi:TPA: TraY domain-containing protein [Enterobacter roggenkampii]